ncbi:MAG: molybdopterin-synthase adenylyltransferase MoeB [Thermoplasmata archaeon]|nr:molybdopterin-synthase adenylyltransferase MoeB [Thermoplasmata archaeon]
MAEVQIKVPSPLRTFTNGEAKVVAEGATVGGVLDDLVRRHTGLKAQLLNGEGRLRSGVTVFLNDEDVRYLEREATAVKSGDVVALVPAIAGGSSTGWSPPRAAGDSLTPDQLRRYSRHLLLPEVGVEGQQRLRRGKVLLVGAGGLGAPSALYLAAAGVGQLGLVDFDKVEISNLQRQILYGTTDVGRPKIEAATARLNNLNPDVKIVPHEGRLTSEHALDILREYDVVVDGTDNFATRYLVNDACVLLGKPNVYGSVYRFEGQASVFDARKGPCYRCLYAEPPPPGLAPSCAEGGVLGVLPGLIGTIQAIETVKILLGAPETLVGRLLLFDAMSMRFHELKLRKNPDCVLCGPNATQTGLIDYPAFCGVADADTVPSGIPEVTVEELKARLDRGDAPFLLDVREPGEYAIAHLPNATLIPRGQLGQRVTELTRASELVVYCRSGNRSAQATRLLLDLGFNNVRNLHGGILAWAEKIDPSIPQY